MGIIPPHGIRRACGQSIGAKGDSVSGVLKRLQSFLKDPPIRYSRMFAGLRNTFDYSAREQMLRTALEFAEWSRLEGDYLEFGVWQGRTFAAAYYFAARYGLDSMRFYAFDSFQGLPKVAAEDSNGSAEFQSGDYQWNRRDFETNLDRWRVPRNRVEIVPGWFSDTLNAKLTESLPLQKAAIVWVDCDLYESTVPVLEFLERYVQDGTVLIFDDWFCFRADPKRGEQKAFAQWLGHNPELRATPFHHFGWHGASFILGRGDGA